MRARVLLAVAALSAACGGSPGEVTGDRPDPAATPDAGAPITPSTSQGPAPGLCAQWLVGAADLSALTPSSDTASLVARPDARGGVTVWLADREGGVTATAFRQDGTTDGASLRFPAAAPPQPDVGSDGDAGPPPPTVHDVEATPGGWLVAWDARPSTGWVAAYDAGGAQLYTIALATNTATIDLGPDGTLGIDDGASIGWVAPGEWTEQLAVTYAPAAVGSTAADPGPLTAWSDGVAYVTSPDLAANVETVAPGGVTTTFPGATPGYGCASYASVLVAGAGGQSAALVAPCGASPSPGLQLDFASTAFAPRSFVFDGPIPASS
ncbi:MAG TPA: hypothetical protein VHS09_11715, partial [Polyangiaceae bacterium]|nr:hypothetical protein [Polyangiaceae bacterium]